LLTAIIGILPGLAKRIVMMLLIVIFGLFSIAHAVVFNIFGNFFSFADFAYLGDGVRFFSFSYLKIRKLLVLSVLFAIALMGGSAWLSAETGRLRRRYEFIGCIAVMILSVASITLAHTGLCYNSGHDDKIEA
jgi:hypothetical protein